VQGGIFSVALSLVSYYPHHWVLPSTLPWGARTFLSRCLERLPNLALLFLDAGCCGTGMSRLSDAGLVV